MGTFSSSKTLKSKLCKIDEVLNDTMQYFEAKDYSVKIEKTVSGGFISITKGGIFSKALGLQTALNTTINIENGIIKLEAKVGLFGQQLLPTIGALFVAWPILIPQIVGLIKQSKLDDEMLQVLEDFIHKYEKETLSVTSSNSISTSAKDHFCISCGNKIPAGAAFCPSCGQKND